MMSTFKCTVLSTLADLAISLSQLTKKVNAMSEALDTLLVRVAEIETVGDSIIAVLAQVRADLATAIANNDMTAVTAVNDRLGAQAAEITAAITESTPVAEEPAPVIPADFV